MNITVKLGEPLWREAGTKEFPLELPAGSTVAELLSEVCEAYPALREYLVGADVPPTVFVGDEMVEDDAPLTDGASAMLVWAVAGG